MKTVYDGCSMPYGKSGVSALYLCVTEEVNC